MGFWNKEPETGIRKIGDEDIYPSTGKYIMIFVVIILVMAVGIGSVFFKNFSPSVTGFVSAATYTDYVNAEVDPSYGYFFAAGTQDAPKEVRALTITGKVLGTGVVNVYLEDQHGQRYLVYSNERQKTFNRITGLAVAQGVSSSASYSEKQFNLKPIAEASKLVDYNQVKNNTPFSFVQVSGASDISYVQYVPPVDEQETALEAQQEGITGFSQLEVEKPQGVFDSWFGSTPYEGSPLTEQRAAYTEFKNECVETCVLFGGNQAVYRFIFEIGPDTKLVLDSITYAVNEETKQLM